NSAYGWDSLQTSAQVLSSALSFLPLTMSQEQELTILAGLITLLAVACFTLFISAKCYNPTTTLVIAIAFCLLPVILYSVGQGNFINLLVCLLPAGGSGLTNSFYFQLRNTLFLQIGSFSIWAPYLMMGAAIIEIPMFFILSIHTYCKHQTV
ncbi:MAG TPA: ABC transporter permease, partial [Clostridiaceae bacterium]|nr:ABC transporter permease [Clostridiaceae bacterium]